MLIFQIKRIIPSETWFNYVVAFFLLGGGGGLGCQTFGSVGDAKRRKEKRMPYN